jgi:hypothetical protein
VGLKGAAIRWYARRYVTQALEGKRGPTMARIFHYLKDKHLPVAVVLGALWAWFSYVVPNPQAAEQLAWLAGIAVSTGLLSASWQAEALGFLAIAKGKIAAHIAVIAPISGLALHLLHQYEGAACTVCGPVADKLEVILPLLGVGIGAAHLNQREAPALPQGRRAADTPGVPVPAAERLCSTPGCGHRRFFHAERAGRCAVCTCAEYR